MKRNVLHSLLCSAGLALCGAALAGDPALCGITTNVRADGTVELSNTGNAAKCEAPAPGTATKPAAPPASPPAAAAPGKPAGTDARPTDTAAVQPVSPSTAPAADAAPADPPKDPRQQYRDAMLEGAPGTTAANPSVSRRYKMMSKDAYQATVLGGTLQGPAAPTPSP